MLCLVFNVRRRGSETKAVEWITRAVEWMGFQHMLLCRGNVWNAIPLALMLKPWVSTSQLDIISSEKTLCWNVRRANYEAGDTLKLGRFGFLKNQISRSPSRNVWEIISYAELGISKSETRVWRKNAFCKYGGNSRLGCLLREKQTKTKRLMVELGLELFLLMLWFKEEFGRFRGGLKKVDAHGTQHSCWVRKFQLERSRRINTHNIGYKSSCCHATVRSGDIGILSKFERIIYFLFK